MRWLSRFFLPLITCQITGSSYSSMYHQCPAQANTEQARSVFADRIQKQDPLKTTELVKDFSGMIPVALEHLFMEGNKENPKNRHIQVQAQKLCCSLGTGSGSGGDKHHPWGKKIQKKPQSHHSPERPLWTSPTGRSSCWPQ